MARQDAILWELGSPSPVSVGDTIYFKSDAENFTEAPKYKITGIDELGAMVDFVMSDPGSLMIVSLKDYTNSSILRIEPFFIVRKETQVVLPKIKSSNRF